MENANKLSREEIEELAKLNEQCFDSSDHYSDYRKCLEFLTYDGKALIKRHNKRIVAYLLYTDDDVYSTTRIGTDPSYRNKGFSKALIKKLLRLAKKDGKPFRTYASIHNIASINLHISCGIGISKIDAEWVWFNY